MIVSNCVLEIRRQDDLPFDKSIERFVGGLCDDGDLVAADGVDETTAFDHGFGAHEDKVDLVHHIGHCGIEHDGTWNSESGKGVVCLDTAVWSG